MTTNIFQNSVGVCEVRQPTARQIQLAIQNKTKRPDIRVLPKITSDIHNWITSGIAGFSFIEREIPKITPTPCRSVLIKARVHENGPTITVSCLECIGENDEILSQITDTDVCGFVEYLCASFADSILSNFATGVNIQHVSRCDASSILGLMHFGASTQCYADTYELETVHANILVNTSFTRQMPIGVIPMLAVVVSSSVTEEGAYAMIERNGTPFPMILTPYGPMPLAMSQRCSAGAPRRSENMPTFMGYVQTA